MSQANNKEGREQGLSILIIHDSGYIQSLGLKSHGRNPKEIDVMPWMMAMMAEYTEPGVEAEGTLWAVTSVNKNYKSRNNRNW